MVSAEPSASLLSSTTVLTPTQQAKPSRGFSPAPYGRRREGIVRA